MITLSGFHCNCELIYTDTVCIFCLGDLVSPHGPFHNYRRAKNTYNYANLSGSIPICAIINFLTILSYFSHFPMVLFSLILSILSQTVCLSICPFTLCLPSKNLCCLSIIFPNFFYLSFLYSLVVYLYLCVFVCLSIISPIFCLSFVYLYVCLCVNVIFFHCLS